LPKPEDWVSALQASGLPNIIAAAKAAISPYYKSSFTYTASAGISGTVWECKMTEFLNSMPLSASSAISEQDASNKLIGYLMFTRAGFVLNATWCQMSKGYRVPSTFIHYSPSKAIPSDLTALFDDMADPDKVPALENPATGKVVTDSSTLSSPNDWLIALQASDPTTIHAAAKAALSHYHKSNISNQSRAGINGPVWECTLGSYLRGKPLGATSTTSEKDASSKLVGFLMLNQAGHTLKAYSGIQPHSPTESLQISPVTCVMTQVPQICARSSVQNYLLMT
jgi:hypothetical protein